MQIELSREQVLDYGNRYIDDEDTILAARMEAAAERGYIDKEDLIKVAKWKWRGGRTAQLCNKNMDSEVKEISAASFSTNSERLRIGALLSLCGVRWPMASVILHFSFPAKYPILDVRAMRTVGGSTLYTLDNWVKYVELCRATAVKYDVTLRTLDRALWAFDKDRPSHK